MRLVQAGLQVNDVKNRRFARIIGANKQVKSWFEVESLLFQKAFVVCNRNSFNMHLEIFSVFGVDRRAALRSAPPLHPVTVPKSLHGVCKIDIPRQQQILIILASDYFISSCLCISNEGYSPKCL